ncbi:MAG: iron-containing alcohol dehydrogenase [bacterium]|nr:iron-containing alcohol dehydrogenase [bacterium]
MNVKEIFQFYLPVKIIFGKDSFLKIGDHVSVYGKKALIITNRFWLKERKILKHLSDELNRVKIRHLFSEPILPEPTTASVDSSVILANSEKIDLVISIGGGSVIDVGKAVSIMVNNKGHVSRYLEVDGSTHLKNNGIQFVAIPTTAGTGSEVTKNSVLYNPKTRIKRSLRDIKMFPDIAIIDPVLSRYMSKELTAFTGIDAFSHLIEGYLSIRSSELTDILGLYGINLIKNNLPKACSVKDDNIKVRSNLSLSSMLGGFMLSNSGMGICHGLAGTLGAKPEFTHSKAIAYLLPSVLEYVSEKTEKAKFLIKLITGSSDIKKIKPWFKNFYGKIGISDQLNALVLTNNDINETVAFSLNASSMKGSPVSVTKKGLLYILNSAQAFNQK